MQAVNKKKQAVMELLDACLLLLVQTPIDYSDYAGALVYL